MKKRAKTRQYIVFRMSETKNMEVCGSVMDGVAEKGGVLESPTKKATEYKVYTIRWMVLFIFVFYSASNSFQWIQYSIIQDSVVKYYGVSSIVVYWTSMIYMITYIPLIFPGSWLLDKTVSNDGSRRYHLSRFHQFAMLFTRLDILKLI